MRSKPKAIAISRNHDLQRSLMQVFMVLALASALYLLFTSVGNATAGVEIGNGLCSVAGAIQNQMGRGIATLAIIFLGISAAVGRVSWGQALMVVAGIAVIYGAGELAGIFGNQCGGVT